MSHPAIIIGGLLVGAILCYAKYQWEKQRHNSQQEAYNSRPEPNLPSVRILGPCGLCDGEVSCLNGYQSPCNHYLHYTCGNAISAEYGKVKFNWSDVCDHCTRARLYNGQRSSSNEGWS